MFDPRVKLFAIFCLTTLALILKSGLSLVVLLVCSFIVSFIFKADTAMLIRKFSRFISVLIVISFTQIFFVKTGNIIFEIGFITVTDDALLRVFSMIVRVMVIVITASVMATENNSRVIASFSKMHIPYIISFMVMITLRFIPLYRESFSDALVSIQLRGLDLNKTKLIKKIKIFSYLMLPVVYEALDKAEDLTIAMQARGFQAMKTRTNYMDLRLNFKDYAMFGLLTALSIFILYTNSF